MAQFTTYNSWGRTRSPKNLAGANGTEITALADTSTLVGITATSAGYATENQRYLIVQLTVYNTSFKVQGYMHASGAWADIKASPTINAVGIWTVEISGIDQVRFVTTGNCTLFAACSTF